MSDSAPTVAPLALGVREAAQAIGVSPATLERLVAVGTAPASFRVGRRRLFAVESLRQWVEAQAEGSAAR